jgi:hypothetical protein
MLVEQYLKIEQTIRQKHLNLNDSCIERGGNSTNHRGVLAQYLDTPIYGRPSDLCHACNNPNCSNPKHLYWGTRKENVKDSIEFGSWSSPYDKMVKKYGEDKAKEASLKSAQATHALAPYQDGKMKARSYWERVIQHLNQK